MSRLTKAKAKLHAQACELLQKDTLSLDDKWFVLEHWQESATHVNTLAGAFFTPVGLAKDFALEVSGRRVIDLCAGIGALSFMAYHSERHDQKPEIVCVELNPDYIEVGKRLLPEATWIMADVFELPDLGRFDCAISNPPFGATKKTGKGKRYTGNDFEYHVIDIASDLADYGAFIVPQMSAPFKLSGQRHYERTEHERYVRFREQTGIDLQAGCGIDTSLYKDLWHLVAPTVEIVCADFEEARAKRTANTKQPDLFCEAA